MIEEPPASRRMTPGESGEIEPSSVSAHMIFTCAEQLLPLLVLTVNSPCGHPQEKKSRNSFCPLRKIC